VPAGALIAPHTAPAQPVLEIRMRSALSRQGALLWEIRDELKRR
jgi:hypothetical protein